jgi:hypothetical protein
MRTGAILAVLLGCGRLGFAPSPSDGVGGDAGGDAHIGSPGAAFVTSTSSTADTVTMLGWAHPVIAAPSMLFVFVATRSAMSTAPPSVTSVVYGTTTLTKIAALCPSCGPGGIDNFELWYAPSPPAGTANIVVTLSGNADGAAGLASSYAEAYAQTLDQPAMNGGVTAGPTLSWTPAADASWAIAGMMDQGGFVMSLLPVTGQVMRSESVCDVLDYTGGSIADQLAIAGGSPILFSWTFGSGTYGTGNYCGTMDASHQWIALGASFR